MGYDSMRRVIFKIVDYFPDENSATIKFCNIKSNVPIDSCMGVAVDLSKLDMRNFDFFSNSLIKKHGLSRVEKQEDASGIIRENIPEAVDDKFEVRDLIGKVVEGKYYNRTRYPLKMRRIEL